jgi:23S rRNA (pseudouridine1915-N3)-methyltransferase
MKLHIVGVGRLKSSPEKILADDYHARIVSLGPKAGITTLKITDFAESQNQSAAARMADEAKLIAGALAPKSISIVLDERGRTKSSEDFAATLRKFADDGVSELNFLIGGADGHAQSTRDTAKLLLAFGPMTWPHRFVRIMLLEQIYRSVTIMLNHPYHRS